MASSSSRWRFLNAMDWLKGIYETFGGGKHPTALLVCVMVLGGVLGALALGGLCLVVANQYQKGQAAPSAAPPASVNTTTGSQSPIIPNNGGNITINGGQAPQPPPPPKGKPK